MREYIQCVTGYSRAQLTRLISQYRTAETDWKKSIKRHTFARKHTREDTVLLAMTDEAHQTLSGALTKKLFERAYCIYQVHDI